MAIAEDPALVLEQFVHDGECTFSELELRTNLQIVANLPAEIAHLMEEMQAKEEQLQKCRDDIHQRDSSLQKFIKQNGVIKENPKDESLSRGIVQNFDKALILQEEKMALSEKAAALVSPPTIVIAAN